VRLDLKSTRAHGCMNFNARWVFQREAGSFTDMSNGSNANLEAGGPEPASAMTLLRVDCSPRGAEANCWRMADVLVDRLITLRPGLAIVHRSLAATPPPLVDHAFARTMGTHTTPERARAVPALAASEALIAELERTQVLVIATPMHNFTVPAALKAWLDQVVRVGRTFTITPAGKIGSLADRPAFVVVSSGGYHTGAEARQPDFLTPYLQAILATIGITNVTFIFMEGLTRGEEALAKAHAKAARQIAALNL
jgi:FMN-dependent NADH-azoreductase